MILYFGFSVLIEDLVVLKVVWVDFGRVWWGGVWFFGGGGECWVGVFWLISVYIV